ncbi:MAG TPA: hypothetical protein PLO37_04500 [Candidatus Hydrogenedentes bacterium]|nr:hypothetical protein [Candidatus Hydrogenedentota bacterium]HPG66085.1 hypothetical protein [Candidatus Hydrogenedentota bacterium]
MRYEYSGFLASLIGPSDAREGHGIEGITFTARDLDSWTIVQRDDHREWEHIPVQVGRNRGSITLEGDFRSIRRLDIPSPDRRFWVSLTTANMLKPDRRLPIDLEKHPVLEVTYRCASPTAGPSLLWTYPGGAHLFTLPPTEEWTTVTRLLQLAGFPDRLDSLSFRLYSSARVLETMEIRSIRLRAMSAREMKATATATAHLMRKEDKPRYPVLDDFVPLGTFMDAEAVQDLVAMLDVSFEDYWNLVVEDIAKHHHNCIALQGAEVFSPAQMACVVERAAAHGIKLVPMFRFPLEGTEDELDAFIRRHVSPFTESPAILAWSMHALPSERAFEKVIHVKDLVERADPNHPMVSFGQFPNAFVLYGRHFSASAVAHFAAHTPWTVTTMVRRHLPLSQSRCFWLIAPAFVSPSDTPDWNGCPEMRLTMNLAFAAGAKGWFSYAYHSQPPWLSGSCRRSLTGPFLTFSDLWAELAQRVYRFNALAPLVLAAQPRPELQKWFGSTSISHTGSHLPEDVPATAVYRLEGEEFNVYHVVCNDLVKMASEQIDVAARSARGLEFYDVAEFVGDRVWAPMPRRRHLEMFPGQAHVILAAKPSACAIWRDQIARRLVEDDVRQFTIDRRLIERYNVDLRAADGLLRQLGGKDTMADLHIMKQARDLLLDASYATPDLCEARSKIIEASSALCACDVTMSAVMARGKVDQVRELGREVLPLAQRLTQLRLDLRKGLGAKILPRCADLVKDAVAIHERMRPQA